MIARLREYTDSRFAAHALPLEALPELGEEALAHASTALMARM